jgi:hypothetical protein
VNGDGNNSNLFTPGASLDTPPTGDLERQAIDSLRGYAYQIAVSALAWLDLEEKSRLYLEVAEDYATVADHDLNAVQIKDTAASGSVTLNTDSVRDAVHAFVDLVARNPGRAIELRYLTTSPIGRERSRDDRPAGETGLTYWRKAAAGADLGSLRAILESDTFSESVRQFVRARGDDAVRKDLLQKIHWDCGQPDMTAVRRELEERLIVFGRDRYHLPAMEAQRLADVLMYHVLKKSILKNASDRVLTRAELYSVVDAATLLSVPRAAIDSMAQLTSAAVSALVGSPTGVALAASSIGWLISDNDLPALRSIIPRPEVEAAIAKAIELNGFVILVGGIGLGKSVIARAVAHKRGGFVIADLRDTEEAEARRRLDLLLGRIGGPTSRVLILEDLDHFEDVGISLSLGRVAEALRRRDRVGLVTSHRRPSARTLTELGLDAVAVIEVPYFSEAESVEVVRATGGDTETWGRLAYIAGAQGHPQLVHAFAMGMAARGWPQDAMRDTVVRWFSSEDIDAERDAARRSLTAALPIEARTLLYRLSLAIGRFDRALAIDISSLAPIIPRAGEWLDGLVGPWIEVVGGGYRVSPLASNAGLGTLTAEEQRGVHDLIATRLLARRIIDASDANMILAHALSGKSTQSLVLLASTVITAEKNMIDLLSDQFFALRVLRTDRLIYPDDPTASRLLRLAQFKLVAATGRGPEISNCVTALVSETTQEPNRRLRKAFESVALATVLCTISIADHVPNWISLLRRFRTLVEADQELRRFKANVEKVGEGGATFFGMLFAIGALGISSVKRLEEVIDALDALDAGERKFWLREYRRKPNDYGLFVNGAWSAEHIRNAVDPTDAAQRYKRMAERTQLWDMRGLALQCHAARSVILDEYGNDKEAALSALDEGVAALGEDIILARARAKVLWRHDDHVGAIKILHDIADQVGRDNPIERAFAMREAAISAAKTNDWQQAETWFVEGQTAAAAAHTDDMQAMAIGLGADAAVAALKIGEPSRALERLADSIVALKSLDAEASLRTAYCHRVVRHTVLWVESEIDARETKIDGKPIVMLPGICSNPEPLAAVRELPLGPLDFAWYMLAEAEIASGADVGISRSLHSRLAEGPIVVSEVALRNRWMVRGIARLDPVCFSKHMQSWLDGIEYMRMHGAELRAVNVLSPARADIPSLARDALAGDYLEAIAVDANLAFCMAAALKGETGSIAALEVRLAGEFGNEFPGSGLFKHWRGESASLSPLDKICADAIGRLREGEHIEPRRIWEIGLRLFEKIGQSNFKQSLTPIVAEWLRAKWRRVIAEESFRLSRPMMTVPEIEATLAREDNDASFVAALLLATSDAVGAPLGASYRDHLTDIVRRVEQRGSCAP